jgi:IS605 OrfB family transposase
MHPQTQFCQNNDCPARGQIGKGNLTVHSKKERRYRCKVCGRTFTASKGTVFFGLKTNDEIVAIVITFQPGFVPVVVNGCGLKSANQYYNKRRAERQAQAGTRSTKRLQRLTGKRNRKVKHLRHIASRRVIDHLVGRGIGTLVIGYNPNWKQRVNIGRVNHQKFISIPHGMLLHMLTYKAQLAGIQVSVKRKATLRNAASWMESLPRNGRGMPEGGSGAVCSGPPMAR